MKTRRAVLVTGGAGYVGSHACKALAHAGYTPVVLDDLSSGHKWAVRWGPLVRGCITDTSALDGLFQRYKPVAVLHFAGLLSVNGSLADPQIYYQKNLVGTLVLLGAMRRNGVSMLVFSSSCTVYGHARVLPISESHPTEPISPYGVTKLASERMMAEFGLAYGLRSVSLRYFNAAGADPDGEIGEAHEPESHLIPLAIRAARDSGFSLSIFGTDYETPDGTAIRDYVHVADLADAHVAALEYLRGGEPSLILNLGTGRGHSVQDVVAAVRRVTGRSAKVSVMARRPGDPPTLVADPTYAASVLGWCPTHSELDEITATASAWYTASRQRPAALEAIG